MNSAATPITSCGLDSRTGGCEAAFPETGSATGFTLHLPLPPSVNTFERDKNGRPLGNRSRKVKSWQREADMATLLQPRPGKVMGDFALDIIWTRRSHRRSDIDNRIKCVLDWLQSRELIENDRFCWDLHVWWGTAPKGCIVSVRRIGM